MSDNLRQLFGAVAAVLAVNAVCCSHILSRLSKLGCDTARTEPFFITIAAFDLALDLYVQVVIAYVISAWQEKPAASVASSKKVE